jgi:hypothetical protein
MEQARTLAIELLASDGLARADALVRRLLGIALPTAAARD